MDRLSYWQSCRWAPWAVVAAFMVIIAVNVALAVFAIRSDTGLVTAHPYELGNGYNRVLDRAAAQEALGWHGDVRFDGNAAAGTLVAALTDRSGTALDGLTVTARLVRPVEPLPEQLVPLTPTSGAGRYGAALALPRSGQWDVRVTAARDGSVFQFTRRVVVR